MTIVSELIYSTCFSDTRENPIAKTTLLNLRDGERITFTIVHSNPCVCGAGWRAREKSI
jgi:hypothetical protein